MAGFQTRENRVPHYQRLFQKADGVRQWNKVPRGKYFLTPFWTLTTVAGIASVWGMGRMVLGHKTFFGSKK